MPEQSIEPELSIEQLIDNQEKIAIIGSPSSTSEISLDILGTAVNKKLVGEFGTFRFIQDGYSHYAMGQITEIQLRNTWLEDPTMRSLTRQHGRVNPISGIQDTHLGDMTISAVFCDHNNNIEPSILGTVPQTGTQIHLVNDIILDRILNRYSSELFYLGKVYGSTPKLPMWFKHFGSGTGGAGEAYHIGIFGKTGSGKSVLGKMILLAYARHPQMGIFIIDPQGEFSKDARDDATPGTFNLNLGSILNRIHKPTIIVRVQDLVFDRWDLFREIFLKSRFFQQISIPHKQNQENAVEEIYGRIHDRINLTDLYTRQSFDQVWQILQDPIVQNLIFTTQSTRQRLQTAIQDITNDPQRMNDLFTRHWQPIANLFRQREGAIRVDHLIKQAFTLENNQRPVVIVDLSTPQNVDTIIGDETIQFLMLKRLLQGITYAGEQAYGRNESLNSLVILDEAHRFAPSGPQENQYITDVRSVLIKASFETRKCGLGWMFINQTLSGVDKRIVGQLRMYLFGFGLGLGAEYIALSELVGKDSESLKLYQSFCDPHSSFDTESRKYSFMTSGPISPLSFQGTPLFFTVFNRPDEFIRINHLIDDPQDQTNQPSTETITVDR